MTILGWLLALTGVAAGALLLWLSLRRGWARALVNLLAIVILGASIVLAVLSLEDEVDEKSCPQPDGSVAAKVEQRRAAARATAMGAARDLRAAQRRDAEASSPGSTRAVREARRRLDAARTRLARWDPVEVAIAETATTSFKLGYKVNGGPRSIAFSASRPIPGPMRLPVYVTPFAHADAGPQISGGDLVAWARLQPGRTQGSLFLCVPGEQRRALPSGQFSGDLVVGPQRVQRLAVPVTLNVLYPKIGLVILVGLTTAFAASWYVFFLRRDQLSDLILYGRAREQDDNRAAAQEDEYSRVFRWPFGFWHGYWRWICSVSGAITIVAGMTAAVTAFSTVYLSSDTWAGSFRDWFALCGAIASGFVAGGTAGKLTQLWPPDLPRATESANGARREESRQGLGGSRPGLPRGGRTRVASQRRGPR